MSLEDILLTKISLSWKDKYSVIPLIWGTESSQIERDRQQNGGCLGLRGEGNGKILFHGYGVSVRSDERVLEMSSGDTCPAMWIFASYHWPLCLQMVKITHFISCMPDRNKKNEKMDLFRIIYWAVCENIYNFSSSACLGFEPPVSPYVSRSLSLTAQRISLFSLSFVHWIHSIQTVGPYSFSA